jgi:hypothetical protein
MLIAVVIRIRPGQVLFGLFRFNIFRHILLVTVNMDWQMLIGGMADEGLIVDAGFFLDWSIGMP